MDYWGKRQELLELLRQETETKRQAKARRARRRRGIYRDYNGIYRDLMGNNVSMMLRFIGNIGFYSRGYSVYIAK